MYWSTAYLVHASSSSEKVEPLFLGDVPSLYHDLHTQHETVDGLVLLEEAAGHVSVGAEQRPVHQNLQPHVQVTLRL